MEAFIRSYFDLPAGCGKRQPSPAAHDRFLSSAHCARTRRPPKRWPAPTLNLQLSLRHGRETRQPASYSAAGAAAATAGGASASGALATGFAVFFAAGFGAFFA